MHDGPPPSRHRRGKNRTSQGQSGNSTPPNEDLDTLDLPPLVSPDGRDLTNTGGAPLGESEATYSGMHPVELSLEGTNSIMECTRDWKLPLCLQPETCSRILICTSLPSCNAASDECDEMGRVERKQGTRWWLLQNIYTGIHCIITFTYILSYISSNLTSFN